MKFVDLKAKLSSLWKSIGQWGMISLGKGFYEFSFASTEDLRRVWTVGSWSLKPGFLHLSPWTPDLNPNAQRQTHAECWVRILGLPQEYWNPKIFFAIAASVGTQIAIDEATSKRTFGHFGRVLMDLDLNNNPCYQILVEREGFAFFLGLSYENLPLFCYNCQVICQLDENCRKPNKERSDDKIPESKNKDFAATRRPAMKYVPKILNSNEHEKVVNYEEKDKEENEENSSPKSSSANVPHLIHDESGKNFIESNHDDQNPVLEGSRKIVNGSVVEVDTIYEGVPRLTPQKLEQAKKDMQGDPNPIIGFVYEAGVDPEVTPPSSGDIFHCQHSSDHEDSFVQDFSTKVR